MIRVSGIIFDSIVDGEGLRTVLFVQGCKRHCEGCHNPETWDLNGGTLMSVNEISKIILDNSYNDGLTISGGEPMLQKESLMELIRLIHSEKKKYNIWMYTGYKYEEIMNEEIIKNVNVVVDGEFILEERDLSLLFRGSKNQRIIDIEECM
jgi:anaerobic ribonucleoside-triphosphate reductase activating protein